MFMYYQWTFSPSNIRYVHILLQDVSLSNIVCILSLWNVRYDYTLPYDNFLLQISIVLIHQGIFCLQIYQTQKYTITRRFPFSRSQRCKYTTKVNKQMINKAIPCRQKHISYGNLLLIIKLTKYSLCLYLLFSTTLQPNHVIILDRCSAKSH